jgi:hypothetical protein
MILNPERRQLAEEAIEKIRAYIGRELLQPALCYDNGDDVVEGKN